MRESPFKVGAWRHNGLHPFEGAAERMRIARIAAGLTVEQMAEALCRAPRTYLKWEAGDLDINKVELFATVMRLPTGWLLMGNTDKMDTKWCADSKVRILPVAMPWQRERRIAKGVPGVA